MFTSGKEPPKSAKGQITHHNNDGILISSPISSSEQSLSSINRESLIR